MRPGPRDRLGRSDRHVGARRLYGGVLTAGARLGGGFAVRLIMPGFDEVCRFPRSR